MQYDVVPFLGNHKPVISELSGQVLHFCICYHDDDLIFLNIGRQRMLNLNFPNFVGFFPLQLHFKAFSVKPHELLCASSFSLNQ